MGSIPGSERVPGEGNGYPLQYSWLENSVDREAWWATVYGVTRSLARKEREKERLCTCIMLWICSVEEKEMATHSSILAWRILWTEEPDGLLSKGSDRVRHDWSDLACMHCTGEGNGNPLQGSCLENPRDRGAWLAAVYGVTQSWTQLKWLSSSSTLSWKCLYDLQMEMYAVDIQVWNLGSFGLSV